MLLRHSIAGGLRAARLRRELTQAQLAEQLGMSQARLSEIERGTASLTAEQFVLALKLFHLPLSSFVAGTDADPNAELRTALHHHGAHHLRASDEVVIPAHLEDVRAVVVETLISGEPRLIAALGPVLVLNADSFDMRRAYHDLVRLGVGARLGWLLDNLCDALADASLDALPLPARRQIRRAVARLEPWIERIANTEFPEGRDRREDLLDASIRSRAAAARLKRNTSEISHDWGVVSALGPDDFSNAVHDAFTTT